MQNLEGSERAKRRKIAVQDASEGTHALCTRCAAIDWEDMILQATERPVTVRHPLTREVILESTREKVPQGKDKYRPSEHFLKIEISSLKAPCPVCLLFSSLFREVDGSGAEWLEFRKANESFYGDADTLYPDFYDAESAGVGSLRAISALGLALEDSKEDSMSRRLRKIDSGKIDIELLRNWISTCRDQHGEECNSVEFEPIPSLRVIDVHTGLIERALPGCKFVTLSYVWGSSQPPAKESQEDRGQGVLETAPQTIKDVAWLTRELGYRYVWVDRYCIPQDDPKAKHDQIQTMDLIYQQSELTIVAAAGEGPEFGLPGIGGRARDVQVSAQVGKHTCLVTADQMCDSFFESKWRTRGWTYQEAICARKCVVFTSREMYFQCKATICREAVCRPERRDIFSANLDGGPTTIWDHIREYSRRQLSFDSDALNGILGIFRQHRMNPNPVYHYWGIPFATPDHESAEKSFLANLCWDIFTYDVEIQRRPDFPSWSWTGWKAPVTSFYDQYREPPKLDGSVSVHLDDGSVTGFREAFERYIKKNEFGKLSRFLTIECWTIELEIGFSDHSWRDEFDNDFYGPWVWPAGKPGLDEDSRVAIRLNLDGRATHTIPSKKCDGPFLGLVFEGLERFADRPKGTGSAKHDGFAIVAMKNGDCYERVGQIEIVDDELSRISTSTFERVARSSSPISDSESSRSLSESSDEEEFKVTDWLPREFQWQGVKLG
ncbi:heterokaryon incompatibility protein-domain-containing protein [Hypoxylon rubiginosum]|uniref:Heterokaryon incompatibility protein-domain-containing protein n=1 Tax=Hypoxylon rubiginosum TaxID=110542 RepID=A0ACB9YW55_9PEZI|nr:heterokaryon incompatibility protein-domain-containing protein [Hypoxylon rubiginosum]